MTTSLGSCIGLKSPTVSKFREPYGLCCTYNVSSRQNNKIYNNIEPLNDKNYVINNHSSKIASNNLE